MKSFDDAFQELKENKLIGCSPNIESTSLSISYHVADDPELNSHGYEDAKGYPSATQFLDDTSNLGRMEQVYAEGTSYVHMLYTYRNTTKALPTADSHHTTAEKEEIYSLTFEILQPEISKLVALMKFKARLLQLVQANVQMLSLAGSEKVVPEELYIGIVRMIDVVVRLDNLKDMKACLQNQFAVYKRAFHNVRDSLADAERYSEEIESLQLFLADPKCPKAIILSHLKEKIQMIKGSDVVFIGLFNWAVSRLSNRQYLLPDEKWELTRVLPHVMYLLDSDSDERSAFNVFRSKHFSASEVTKLFKQYPVVPLYGEMHISLIYILQRCPHYNDSQSKIFGILPSEELKTRKQYSLSEYWTKIRQDYESFVSCFTLTVRQARTMVGDSKYAFRTDQGNTGWKGSVGRELSGKITALVLEGIRMLGCWKDHVVSQAAFKYSRPAPKDVLKAAKANEDDPGIEYERVVRYNYSETECRVLVDTIALIKSLASIIQRAEDIVGPIIRLHVYYQVQAFVQDKLNGLLHKVDKKKGSMKGSLLAVRELVADWETPQQQNEYKEKEKKRKASVKELSRATPLSSTQLTLFRFLLQSLFDERTEGMKGKGFWRTKELSKSDVELLDGFHRDTYFYPYLLDLPGTLRRASDLGDLWYREFYLEMTNCVQFPIAKSLPWILMKGIIENPSSDMLESILYVLDIYNDASHTALHYLKQQFVYDEIEAEVNLVVEQLTYLLADHFYSYYKSVASSRALDQAYRRQLQRIQNRPRIFEVDKQRLEITAAQRHVQLLGRSVDLNYLVAHYISNTVRQDVDLCISRFENSGISGITELHQVLQVIQNTHKLLSENMELVPFETILRQCDKRASPVNFSGRIAKHVSEELILEVVPGYCFNSTTERFTKQEPNSKRQGSIRSHHNLLYGSGFAKAFERVHKLERGFVGQVHTDAIANLLGREQVHWVVECLVASMEESQGMLLQYTTELAKGLDKSIKLPKYQFGAALCFESFVQQLDAIVNHPDLHTHVFQRVRESGNAIVLLRLLDNAIQRLDHQNFIQTAPYVGLDTEEKLTAAYWEQEVDPSSTPIAKVVDAFAKWAEIKNQREALNPDIQPIGAPVLDKNSTVSQFKKQATSVSKQCLMELEPCALFENVIEKLGEVLVSTDAVGIWDSTARNDQAPQLFNPEHSTDFHRIWSAILFAFCVPNNGKSNFELFGDGPVWAGSALIMLLGQKDRFELLDFNYHTMRVNNYQRSCATPNKAIAVDEEIEAKTQRYLDNVRKVRLVSNSVFSLFAGPLKKVGVSATGGSARNTMLVFHPPEV